MNNSIGANTGTYEQYSAEEALRGISKCGFNNVELVYSPGISENVIPDPLKMKKKDVGKILNLCKKYKLKPYCLSVFGLMNKDAVNTYKKVIEIADLLKVNYIIIDTGEYGTEDTDELKIFYEDMRKIADYAKLKNKLICFEVHGGLYGYGAQGVKLIEEINHPNIRLNYDTGNVIRFGNKRPESDIICALPYMEFMHLKDKAGKLRDRNYPALGEGNVDFKEIFKHIKDYKGPITVEVELFGEKHSLSEINSALKKSYDFLKKFGYAN